jgi:hypothetical protein
MCGLMHQLNMVHGALASVPRYKTNRFILSAAINWSCNFVYIVYGCTVRVITGCGDLKLW